MGRGRLARGEDGRILPKHAAPMVGDRFGELTIIRPNQQKPLVQCSCGAEPHYVLASNLRSGASTRCNKCAKKASSHYRKNYYGYADIVPDEELRRRLLNRFSSACARCHNPKNSQFHAYGARGITVHEVWRFDRRAFLVYVLALPGVFDSSLDMDRIDNDKGYEPGNIQFIPHGANVAKKPSYGHRRVQKLKDRIADLESCLRHCTCGAAKSLHDQDE